MAPWLAEIGFLFLLAGVVIWAPAPRPLVWVLFLVTWTLPLVPLFGRSPEHHRSTTSALLLIALAFLGLECPIRWTSSLHNWWPMLPAGALFLAGLLGVADDWRTNTPWSTIRRELILSGVLLLILGAVTVIITFFLTKYYSDMKIPLGDPGFLLTCLVLGCTWFGLDETVRRIPLSTRRDTLGWLWNRRHSVLLGLAALAIVLRAISS